MNGVFKLRNTPHYNIRHISHFSTDPIHSVYNRIESITEKIWEQIPSEIKNNDSLDGFKKEIKKWKPTECPCRIARLLYQIKVLFNKNINISRIEISSF